MKRALLLLPIASYLFTFASLAVTPPTKSEAAKLADFFRGSWEGEGTSEVEKKKESGKVRVKCESIGKNFGSQCLLTWDSDPEYWFIGHNQKNESNHVFIVTPKGAHDHAAKWVSEKEIMVTPIMNNPDKCSVISLTIKKTNPDQLVFEGTETNKEGKLVTFFIKVRRMTPTR